MYNFFYVSVFKQSLDELLLGKKAKSNTGKTTNDVPGNIFDLIKIKLDKAKKKNEAGDYIKRKLKENKEKRNEDGDNK